MSETKTSVKIKSPKNTNTIFGLLIFTEFLVPDICSLPILNEIYLRFMNITIKYCC